MKAKVIKIFFSVVLLIGLSCKNEPTKTEHRAIKLTAEDASCIEAWLRIEVWTKPSTVILQKGDSTISTLQLTTMDTVIVDEGLQPNQMYQYSAQLISPIPPVWLDDNLTSQVQVQTMDTTSHDFRWEIYTLGDGTGSSCLYDVAIINDTLAYAVGEIYQDYNKDYQIYNAAKWNGGGWDLMRIKVKLTYESSQMITDQDPLKTIYGFNENDIWVVSSAGGVSHWNGTEWEMLTIPYGEGPGGANKLWGTSSRDLYAVGNNGLIAHYDGSSWRRIESPAFGGTGGTELDVYDIYGGLDEKTGGQEILAVASKIGVSSDKAILQIKGGAVSALSYQPIRYSLESVWFVAGRRYYVVGDGIFEKRRLTEMNWNTISQDIFTTIRGNALNDIFAVGVGGRIEHYNGISWKNYQRETGLPSCIYGSVAVRGNLVIAVGFNGNRAIALIGKR